MKKTVLAAVASFAIASGAGVMQASAADYFEPAPAPVPAPILHDWSGFYIGGHVGYGGADFDGRAVGRDPAGAVVFDASDDFNADGIVGGLHGGFNWQVGSFVLGVEGDVSFVDWSDSAIYLDGTGAEVGRARVDVDFLASVRGRLGMALDTLLLYGTGGIAFADAEARASATHPVLAETATGKVDFDDVGWVVGGGAEWAAIPNRFSVGVEGLWYFFDDSETTSHTFTDGSTVTARATFDDAWVVRARANFHF